MFNSRNKVRNIFLLFILILLLTLTTSYKFSFYEKITISAIGDLMAHFEQQEYALSEKNKYSCLFEPTKNIFLKDDLTFGNLETVISDELPIAGYPQFNAKSSYVDAIKDAGIEIVSLSNNHSLDKGISGIISTIKEVKKRELIYAGTGHNPNEARKPVYFRKNGILIGFISATFSTNGIPNIYKKNRPFVNLIYMDDDDALKEIYNTIEETEKKVDLLIVSYHAGVEYVNEPIDIKVKILKKMAEKGADVVLSHHPHVLQPVEYYKTKNGRNVLIAYSLGNFASAQARYIPPLNKSNKYIYDSQLSKTSDGMILQFDVVKQHNKIEIVNAGIYPTFNICLIKKDKKKKYFGYITYPMENILSGDLDNDERFKSNIKHIKTLVKYRHEKIKKLVNLPIKKL